MSIVVNDRKALNKGGKAACPNITEEPEAATVTSVTVSPDTANVVKGGWQEFAVEVSGTNAPA